MRKRKRLFALLLCCAFAGCAPTGNEQTPTTEPSVAVAPPDKVTISAGGGKTLGIREDHSLWIWGGDYTNPLVGGSAVYEWPEKVLDEVAVAAAGFAHFAAIKTDGTLWMWGQNGSGQLGDGTTQDSTQPKQVMENIVQVALGQNHSAAIDKDGALWMWGNGAHGKIGNIPTPDSGQDAMNLPDQLTPVKVLSEVAQVSLGGSHSAALKKDGTLWLWGNNDYGQLGDLFTPNLVSEPYPSYQISCQTTPAKAMDGIKQVSLGAAHTAVLKQDGTLWLWGENGADQIGNNGAFTDKPDIAVMGLVAQREPVQVLSDVQSIATGYYHSAAILQDGSLWMFGSHDLGQSGNGAKVVIYAQTGYSSANSAPIPEKIMEQVEAVWLGASTSYARKTDGTIWAWGDSACLGQGGASNDFAEIVYASPEAKAQLQMPPMPLQTVPKLFSFEPIEGTE